MLQHYEYIKIYTRVIFVIWIQVNGRWNSSNMGLIHREIKICKPIDSYLYIYIYISMYINLYIYIDTIYPYTLIENQFHYRLTIS